MRFDETIWRFYSSKVNFWQGDLCWRQPWCQVVASEIHDHHLSLDVKQQMRVCHPRYDDMHTALLRFSFSSCVGHVGQKDYDWFGVPFIVRINEGGYHSFRWYRVDMADQRSNDWSQIMIKFFAYIVRTNERGCHSFVERAGGIDFISGGCGWSAIKRWIKIFALVEGCIN